MATEAAIQLECTPDSGLREPVWVPHSCLFLFFFPSMLHPIIDDLLSHTWNFIDPNPSFRCPPFLAVWEDI